MRLCTYVIDGQMRPGLVTDHGIVDLARRTGHASLRALIAAGDVARAGEFAADPADHALDEVSLAPVIPDPEKIYCIGLNYRDHVAEMGRAGAVHPTVFARYPASQVGHGAPLIKPRESDQFDYEGELAVIIGKEGRRIPEADALSHVAGYACYVDGSIRDFQNHTQQYLPGKTFWGTGGFGPWMVTADEIPDPSALHLQTRVNGQVMQDSDLTLMINPVPRLIAYLSVMLPLMPGDVIVSGTPGGVGAARKPPVWLRDGDVVEVDISGVGVLRHPVRAED